jgi:hypothetical protein
MERHGPEVMNGGLQWALTCDVLVGVEGDMGGVYVIRTAGYRKLHAGLVVWEDIGIAIAGLGPRTITHIPERIMWMLKTL